MTQRHNDTTLGPPTWAGTISLRWHLTLTAGLILLLILAGVIS